MTWVNSIIQFAHMQFYNNSSVNCIVCLPTSSEVSSDHHLSLLYFPLPSPTPLSVSTEEQPALFSWFSLWNILMHPSFQTQGTYAFPCNSSESATSLTWFLLMLIPVVRVHCLNQSWLTWFSFLLHLLFSFAYFFHAILSFFPCWWKVLLAKPSYPLLFSQIPINQSFKKLKIDFQHPL